MEIRRQWNRFGFMGVGAGLALLVGAAASHAVDYHVGPDQAIAKIGDVPWYRLLPGDTVYIHYQASPYHEKVLISTRGTPTQWIRVLGVKGPNGELPIISGDNATTSTNMHNRWPQPDLVQYLGLVQVMANADTDILPGYIEIANLQIQDAYSTYRFTAENGTALNYDGFAAAIYLRSVQHILIHDNVLTNCGQAVYDWTGDGSSGGDTPWDGLSRDLVIRGNYLYNNGNTNSWTEHQTYTESDGVIIEYNHYGPQRSGAWGSQLKDRSAGTVIRYNFIEQSDSGWDMDLVNPQESWDVFGKLPSYKQAFVYGNIIFNDKVYEPNVIHWNQDDQEPGDGRADLSDGRLFFYDNTILTVANQSDMSQFDVFNVTWGSYDCPPGSPPGIIDVRNNVFAVLPRTAGKPIPQLRFGYCGQENFNFGKNWVSPGYTINGATVTGQANLFSPIDNNPGFVNAATGDVHLLPTSTARGLGGALAAEVISNYLGLDLTPTQQYQYHQSVVPRSASGAGSDVGALDSGSASLPTLTIQDASHQEGSSGTATVTVTIRLSAPSTSPVTVGYGTR